MEGKKPGDKILSETVTLQAPTSATRILRQTTMLGRI
jgi:hypothetical protein